MKKILKSLCFVLIGVVFFGFFLEFSEAKSPAFTFRKVEGGIDGPKLIFQGVRPGEIVHGKLIISLIDDIPAIFKLEFLDDYSFKLDSMDLSEAEKNYYSYLNWIDLKIESPIHLLGRGVLEIPFEVSVPEGASPGDYVGMFIATIESYGDKVYELLESPDSEKVGTGTRVVLGLGLQFVLSVVGEIEPQVKFNNFSYYKETVSEAFNLVLDYENLGNVAVVPKAVVNIKNFWGRDLFSGDYKFSLLSPLKETTTTVKLSTKDFYFDYGVYDVEVDLYYDVFMRELGESLVYYAGKASMRIYYFPPYLFLSLIVVLVFILSLFVRKYFLLYLYSKNAKEYLIKDNDTLQSISSKYKINPKKIIFLNKLKEPYFVESGKTLLIPLNKKNEKK